MKCKLSLIMKPITWDNCINLPAYFQAEFFTPEIPQCHRCKGYFDTEEQSYLIDPTNQLLDIKKAVKKITGIRKRIIILYNVDLWCLDCFADQTSIQNPPAFHRVIIKKTSTGVN